MELFKKWHWLGFFET